MSQKCVTEAFFWPETALDSVYNNQTEQDTEILPLRVTCATQHSMDNFFTKTLTGVTFEKFSDIVIIRAENKIGLSTLYNQAIEEAAHQSFRYLCDDLEILDFLL